VKRLYIPFVWELLLIITTIFWHKQSFILFFIFYLGLFIFFYFINKQFSFKKLYRSFREIKAFWLPVLLTVAGMLIVDYAKRMISTQLAYKFHENIVFIVVPNEFIPTFFYAFMMIALKPVAEELLYRRVIIRFDNKKLVALLTVVSLFLCAVTRAHGWLGIAEWMLMALPFTIAYLITKNIYVSVMAHIIYGFYDNAYSICYAVARLFLR